MRVMANPVRWLGSVVVLLSAALVLPAEVHAQPESGGCGRPLARGRAGGMVRGLRQLSLTADQQDQIRSLAQASREASLPLREQLRASRHALREVVNDEVVNPSAIQALYAQIAPLQAEATVQRAHTRSAILALLTFDQLAELQLLRETARERFRERVRKRREECGRPQQ